MRKFIKNTLLTLLNPISPISILIVGWLLTILVTQPNDKFPNFINSMIENSFTIFFFIIFWIIFAVIYSEQESKINFLTTENENKDIMIREKERQLNDSAGIILNRSGDFANFNRLLRFNEVLKDFTENNTIIECVQMYSYSTKRTDNIVNIKVTFYSGYCSDGIDINNLAQCNYDIDYNDYARKLSITMFDKNRLLGKDNEELENYLLNGKRTGILNSILLEDIFMFKYTRNSHKKDGRAYVAFPLKISMKNYICVFSIHTLDLDKNIDLEYEIKSLRQDIVKRFEKSSIHYKQ